MTPDDLAAIRERDAQFHTSDIDHARTGFDRRYLLAEVDRLAADLDRERQMRVAFEQAAADLAQAGISERDALRKVVKLLSERALNGTEQQGAE